MFQRTVSGEFIVTDKTLAASFRNQGTTTILINNGGANIRLLPGEFTSFGGTPNTQLEENFNIIFPTGAGDLLITETFYK